MKAEIIRGSDLTRIGTDRFSASFWHDDLELTVAGIGAMDVADARQYAEFVKLAADVLERHIKRSKTDG